MLQKETVRKWNPRQSLKNITDQEGCLKIPVHLSQPVLFPYTYILPLNPIKQIIYLFFL